MHLFVPAISDSFSTFQGDFHVVEYLGWETTYTEIVPSDRWVDHIFLVVTTCSARRISFAFLLLRLRPKSAEACITGASFFKFSLPVPQELQVSFFFAPFLASLIKTLFCQEFCADEKALEIHNDFMKAVDAVHIKYCPEKVVDPNWIIK